MLQSSARGVLLAPVLVRVSLSRADSPRRSIPIDGVTKQPNSFMGYFRGTLPGTRRPSVATGNDNDNITTGARRQKSKPIQSRRTWKQPHTTGRRCRDSPRPLSSSLLPASSPSPLILLYVHIRRQSNKLGS